MDDAELVTFGGSMLDRAAHLRRDGATMARLAADPKARAIVLWRGKPLVAEPGHGALVRLPMDHALVAPAPRLFLGMGEAKAPLFAADLSAVQVSEAEALGTGFADASLQTHPDLPDAGFAELRAVMVRLSPRDAELAATAKAVFGWHRSHRFCAACGTESRPCEAGWQRRCPACGTRHFPRTDPVVIMLVTHGNDLLIGRTPGWPEGFHSLLAGFVEPGEPIEAAVRREVFEETGVTCGAVRYLASQPWPFPASLMIGCHAMATSREITLDPMELEDAFWISREEMARVMRGEHPRIRPARPGAIAHFLVERWLQDRLA